MTRFRIRILVIFLLLFSAAWWCFFRCDNPITERDKWLIDSVITRAISIEIIINGEHYLTSSEQPMFKDALAVFSEAKESRCGYALPIERVPGDEMVVKLDGSRVERFQFTERSLVVGKTMVEAYQTWKLYYDVSQERRPRSIQPKP